MRGMFVCVSLLLRDAHSFEQIVEAFGNSLDGNPVSQVEGVCASPGRGYTLGRAHGVSGAWEPQSRWEAELSDSGLAVGRAGGQRAGPAGVQACCHFSEEGFLSRGGVPVAVRGCRNVFIESEVTLKVV